MNKIKFYRKQKGITQKRLHELTGISEISIRKYESNDRKPKIEQLEKIATALEVPILYFLDIDNSDKPSDVGYNNLQLILSECTSWISDYISLCGYEDNVKAQEELIDILSRLKSISQLQDTDSLRLYLEINEFISFKLSQNKKDKSI